ncbi:CpsD/CapB family tyrosine-protein kinase [Bacillaceae bacterium Marseille-Q3522]|nr:CpsD/CapB family tyrosine-protein kinase [Bacillaceae bacterium Marseille-Q3522]
MVTNRAKRSETEKRLLISYLFPHSKISDQVRTIRTNLYFMEKTQKHSTLLVTSPESREGTTTVISNIGISMAQQKERVLLIDANIKKPNIHSAFQLSNSLGLTNVLEGETHIFEAIKHTGIGKLDVLTSGPIPSNQAELMGGAKMTGILAIASEAYDIVLIDSAPILEATSTQMLAGQCDAVVLVVQKGKTKQQKVLDTQKIIDLAKAKLIGVILNER